VKTPVLHRLFGSIAMVVIGAAIIWGFVLVGSPISARLRRFDDQRLEDLQAIEREVEQLCVEREFREGRMRKTWKAPLPTTLDEVAEKTRGTRYTTLDVTDPETGAAYEYKVTGQTTYELCATFGLVREYKTDMFWNHPAGPHCFTIDAMREE